MLTIMNGNFAANSAQPYFIKTSILYSNTLGEVEISNRSLIRFCVDLIFDTWASESIYTIEKYPQILALIIYLKPNIIFVSYFVI